MSRLAGTDALAVPPGDWMALADAVETLMSDPTVYQRTGKSSLEAVARVSWNRAALGTLDAIERTLRR